MTNENIVGDSMKEKSMFYRINIFIRSLLFSVIMSTSVMFYSFICLMALPLPFRYRFTIVAAFTTSMLWVLKVTCHVKYEIKGLENIPKDRVGVVLCKHQSTWETFLMPMLFHGAAIILKRELLWVPFFGWGLAVVDPIAINRSDKSSAMEQIITKGKKCLDGGRWVVMFPEGTRIAYGKVGNYRAGGARLAVATHYPVLPIAHNAGRYWPKRGLLKKPGTITVVIGPLMETTGKTPEEITAAAKEWIEGTIKTLN